MVDEVIDIIDNKKRLSYEFSDICKIYLNATENIRGYLSKYNLNGKNVLSVAGSGDQAFNAYLKGADNVDVFDINKVAKFQVDFKKCAIENLDHTDFCKFFSHNFSFLDKSIYEKFSNKLSSDTYKLFNYLYSNYEDYEIFRKIYFQWINTLSQLKRINIYMDNYNYDKLGNILKNKSINFINSNILDLPSKLDKKYDLIILSNVCDYIVSNGEKEDLINYKELLKDLSNYLNKDGVIQAGYIYSDSKDTSFRVSKFHKKMCEDSEFEMLKILPYESKDNYYRNRSSRDTVLIYKK